MRVRIHVIGWDTLSFFRRRVITQTLAGQIDVQPVDGRFKLDELTIDTSKNYTRVSALLQNIAYLTQTAQQLQVASISYINFAGLISVGALAVGIIRKVPLIEIFAPYGLSIVFIFLIQLYTDIERLTTIREVLEAHANRQMTAPAFLGLNKLSSKYRGRGSVRLSPVLLAIPLFLFGYYSIVAMAGLVKSSSKHGHEWLEILQVLNYIGLGLCIAIILWAGWEMFNANKRARREVQETFGDLPRTMTRELNTINTNETAADTAH
jgi:hypothetical protein